MAHEIDESAGYAAAAFARQPAWHKLGKVLPELMSPEEALQAAGLDWEVECQPTYRINAGGNYETIEDRRIVVRKDTQRILGHVGNQYVPLQNRAQKDFMEGLMGEGCKIESAGALRDGKRVWFLADIQSTFEPVPGDPVKPFLLCINGHDGLTRWQAMLTEVRVVCSNTLAVAMDSLKRKDARFITLKHNGRLDENIEQAKNALMLAKGQNEWFAEQAKALVAKKMRTQQLSQFFVEQVEKLKFHKERSEMVIADLAAALDSPTNSLKGMRGTAWQAINVWSEWLDYAPRKTSPDIRLESIWMGQANNMKADAWQTLLATAA